MIFRNILKAGITLIACLLAITRALAGDVAQSDDANIIGSEVAVLTQAPNVPPPITRTNSTKVIVTLEVRELVRPLADGVNYTFWTFGGDVPGSFIRVREGDLVEFHLNNHPENKMPHNIDLHAVTGPGGGATSSFTAPGHSSQFSFKALNPGLYVYHCATAPVPMHVANGMYGLIFVQPKSGMPKVDHEYYVMQGEFYTAGAFGQGGTQTFSMDKALDERPTYVVFNGAVDSLVGDRALKAKVGETVRLFVGNAGINLISSFHIIGEIFDVVYQEGGTLPSQRNVSTTLIPAGGASVVEFKCQVPGTYSIVDHSLTRAFNKGALGELKVEGPPNPLIYSGKEAETVYAGKPGDVSKKGVPSSSQPNSKETQFEKGKSVFNQTCFACHQPNGRGLPGVFPPLAGSDYLMADKQRSIRAILGGLSGGVVVNGTKYVTPMPPLSSLSDEQIADVLTFVRNSWGNSGDPVTPDEVRQERAKMAKAK